MEDEENIKKFLVDLCDLTNKYKIFIIGCGCCGSPALLNCEQDDFLDHFYFCDLNGENLTWGIESDLRTKKYLMSSK
jgi:hypothetical protein